MGICGGGGGGGGRCLMGDVLIDMPPAGAYNEDIVEDL